MESKTLPDSSWFFLQSHKHAAEFELVWSRGSRSAHWVYGCCLDECGCSSCQTELVAEQGLQCGCHDGQMGHIELVPDASLGAMERPGNAIRAPFLRPGPCSVHLYPPRRTSSCHCAARVRCHLPGALACGPDSSLRVQGDPSDEAALSSAALPFALPCRAGAVVDFRASSILSGL